MCLFSEVGRQGASTPHSSQLYVYRLLHICDAVRKSMKLKEENSHLLQFTSLTELSNTMMRNCRAGQGGGSPEHLMSGRQCQFLFLKC